MRIRPALAWVRVALAALSLAVLGGVSYPHAWDSERMLQAARRLGPSAAAGAQALQSLLSSLEQREEADQVQALNQFFNRRIVFEEDAAAWGTIDYWASPLESLEKGRGDCEDFAIAKYFGLMALGLPAARLRLVYVRARLGDGAEAPSVAHMVLAYYPAPGREPLILDNLIGDIRAASRRPDLEPVFSFNSEGLWQGTGSQSAGNPAARLSKWREVLAKASAEGFL